MNWKSWITLFLWIGWGFFSFHWIKNVQKDCPSNSKRSSLNNSRNKSGLPIFYFPDSSQAHEGPGFENFKKAILSNLGPQDTLEIQGLYYAEETKGEALGLERANSAKSLWGDTLSIPITTSSILAKDSLSKSSSPRQAVQFMVISDTKNLVKKLKDKVLIYFSVGSGTRDLDPSISDFIKKLSISMKSQKALLVEIIGYTDNSGNESENLILSQERANFIKSKLENFGIESTRIKSEGKGSMDPISDNTSPKGRTLNRRVVIKILNQ